MAAYTIGSLVNKAKGDDRSLRDYARDSGVDVAIISKIINETYVPKKTEVYKLLTSSSASPRGGVTYDQLVEASKQFHAKLIVGKAAALVALGPLAIPMVMPKNTKGEEDAVEDNVIIHSLIALSNGLILKALGTKNIAYKIADKPDNTLNDTFDMYLSLSEHEVNEYIFRYAIITEEHQTSKNYIRISTRKRIEELTFLNPSSERKVSIVTNSQKAYDYMISFKDKLSYNGELSVILVDTKGAKLLKEEYISHYAGENAPSEIILV